LLGKRPGPTILMCGGLLFLLLVVCLLLLGAFQPRCNAENMPCVINEKGGCLCSARAADGTCWHRMEPALKCYRSSVVVKSGICQGNYESRFCGKSQEEVDLITDGLGTATTELHPNNFGNCNMSYVLENSRCRFPQARQETPPGRPFVQTDCCRAPMQTCSSDTDCCNCGQESQACVSRLRCLDTRIGPNGTVISPSIECEAAMDACLQFEYPGCLGREQQCTDNTLIPYDTTLDPSCCEHEDPARRCECRAGGICNSGNEFEGCPCFETRVGCFRRTCVQTSLFFADGGIERVLEDMGARNIKLCYGDNCNQ